MATFIPQVTDRFPEQQLHTPNYEFLSQVYGTHQQNFERGVNSVKTLASSLMNKELTKRENITHRDELFKKIDSQIKSISNLDLSNLSNVSKARSIFDPLVNDMDIMYDMDATQHLNRELTKAEIFKNSTDPKVRNQYNDLARENLLYAKDNLANAKRGDLDIYSKTKQESFIAFEDYNEELEKRANEAKIKVERVYTKNGYITKTINGDGTQDIFSNWARTQLGNKYDKQFEIEAKVMKERQIRNLMSENNLDRNSAELMLANNFKDKLLLTSNEQKVELQSELKIIENQIKDFESSFPNGLKKDSDKQTLEALKEKQELYKKELKGIDENINKFSSEEGTLLVSNNFVGYISQELKNDASKKWGVSRAISTQEIDVKPDEVYLTNVKMQFDARENEKKRQNDLMITRMKLSADYEIASNANKLKILELQADGKLPSDYQIGSVESGEVSTKYDVLLEAGSENIMNIFDKGLAKDGVVNFALGEEDYVKFSPTIQKLKQMADNQQITLTETDKKSILELGEKLDINVVVPKTKADALSLVLNLSVGGYNTAKTKLANNITSKKVTAGAPQVKKTNELLSSLSTYLQGSQKIMEQYDNIAKLIVNKDGSIKKGYEKAKVIGVTQNGNPMFDLSLVDIAQRDLVSNAITGYDYTSVTGGRYSNKGVKGAEIKEMLNSNLFSTVILNGNDITESVIQGNNESSSYVANLKKLNFSDLETLFETSSVTKVNPSRRSITIELNQGVANNIAKSLDMKSPSVLQIEIPFDKIQGNKALSRYASIISKNTLDFTPEGPISQYLALQPYGSYSSPSTMDAIGFSYTVTGMTDINKNYGVNILVRAKDPVTNKMITQSGFIKIPDKSDPKAYNVIDESLNTLFETWSNNVILQENEDN